MKNHFVAFALTQICLPLCTVAISTLASAANPTVTSDVALASLGFIRRPIAAARPAPWVRQYAR